MPSRKQSAVTSDGNYGVEEEEEEQTAATSAADERRSSRMATHPQSQRDVGRKPSSVASVDSYDDERDAVVDDRRSSSRASGPPRQKQQQDIDAFGSDMSSSKMRLSSKIRFSKEKDGVTQIDADAVTRQVPPDRIVWPPGMESRVKKATRSAHHPIAPPGLEHLVTEEQWEEYWTWLNWYSAWQVWYLKGGKSKRTKGDKRRKHGSDDRKEPPKNANWWLDVSDKKSVRDCHRSERQRITESTTKDTNGSIL